MTAPHFLPEYFPRSERFDIKRYLPERAEHRTPGVYTPFGIGMHRCLGAQAADLQITSTVAVILRELDLELAPMDYEVRIKSLPTPHPDHWFQFAIRDRR